MGVVLQMDEHRPGWLTGKADCYTCGHTCLALFHASSDPSALECPSCGHLSLVVPRTDGVVYESTKQAHMAYPL